MSYFYKSGSKPSSFKPTLELIAVLLIVAAPKLCAVPQATPQLSGKGNAVENSNASAHNSSQAAKGPAPEEPPEENKLGLQTIKNIVRDQRQIWTSPAHIRLGHADWLVPYAGLTAGFLVTDRDASLHLSNSPSTLKHYRDFSNYGLAGMGGAVGGIYVWGKATNDPHKQETGIEWRSGCECAPGHGSPQVLVRSRAPDR